MTKNNDQLDEMLGAIKDAYADSELETAIKHIGMAFTDAFNAGAEFLELAVAYTSNVAEDAADGKINITINNPVAERSTDSINKLLRKKASESFNRDEKLDTYHKDPLKNLNLDITKDFFEDLQNKLEKQIRDTFGEGKSE